MVIRIAWLALATYLPLAACSPSFAAPEATRPIANSNVPRLKAGLWRHLMTIDGRSGSGEECDAARSIIPPRQEQCLRFSVSRTANGRILLESICKSGDFTITSRALYEGDFSSAFMSNVTGVIEKPSGDLDHFAGHESYRYLGPCPATMEPEN